MLSTEEAVKPFISLKRVLLGVAWGLGVVQELSGEVFLYRPHNHHQLRLSGGV